MAAILCCDPEAKGILSLCCAFGDEFTGLLGFCNAVDVGIVPFLRARFRLFRASNSADFSW